MQKFFKPETSLTYYVAYCRNVAVFSSYTHFHISGFYTISYLVKDDTTGMGHRTFNFFSLSDLFLEHKTYLHILL